MINSKKELDLSLHFSPWGQSGGDVIPVIRSGTVKTGAVREFEEDNNGASQHELLLKNSFSIDRSRR